MNLQSKFGYCIYCILTLIIGLCKWDGITHKRTDEQTDGWTDNPITRYPQLTFQAGGIKI